MSFRILFFIIIFLFLAGISSVHADVLNVVPNAKHANDNTTEAISEITSDNSSVNPDTLSAVAASDGAYTVDKNAVMQFTTFDVSAIPVGSTITGAVLHLQYGAEDVYSGTNAVRYDNGSGLTSTGITPTDITGFSSDLTYNLFSAGVDTLSEIQDLDIEFTNNDGASADAIHFDYLWITVTYTPPDTTAPAAVSDLALSNPSNSAMTVSWTAPGDDGSTGTATSYDLRYSTSAITAGNFSSATQVTGEPTPSIAGSAESMTVSGLSATTLYYFAVKTSDEVPNTSAISNVPSLSTTATPDTTPPAAITNLTASSPSNSAITLSWTSPGDDGSSGTASSYDIRYSTSNITDGNWSGATQVSDEPAPQVAGTSQSMTVSGLSASTLYYFALKTSDEAPNTSALSNVASVTTLVSSVPTPVQPTPSRPIPKLEREKFAPSRVDFSGQSYPGSKIELLQKTQYATDYQSVADSQTTVLYDGSFQVIAGNLSAGDYFFSLRAEDKNGKKSTPLVFPIKLSGSDEFVLKEISIPPTVKIEETVVAKGDPLKISGYAPSYGKIELEVDGKMGQEGEIDSASGFYALSLSTGSLDTGTHYVKVRRRANTGIAGSFSNPLAFKISSLASPRADLNHDNKVDIFDWSIFLFRWSSQSEDLRQGLDLDKNGKVDIFDFSIFLTTMKI